MKQNYEMALAEVNVILKNTDLDLVSKIPDKIKKFIEENMNLQYEPNIDFTKPISQQKLMKETEAILSLIFRSYWATEQEKEELKKQDSKVMEEFNKSFDVSFPYQFRKKQNVNFEKSNLTAIPNESTSILVVNKVPWYKKFLKIFFNIHGK